MAGFWRTNYCGRKNETCTVLVIGAGVAGLAAIAAARGLGAIVKAFDTREAVGQVQSLGAEFLELEFEESGEGSGGYAKVMSKVYRNGNGIVPKQAKTTDIIITTALIPGKPAPLLVPEDVVAHLKPGSVIIDMAAETGGNCALTKAGEVVDHNGIKIVGYTDLTSRLPAHASQFFGTNIYHLLDDMGGATEWRIDLEDDAVRGALVCHERVDVASAQTRAIATAKAPAKAEQCLPPAPKEKSWA